MIALFKKEIQVFFNTMIGGVIIALFLLTNGIILWGPTQFNILKYGYASLDMLFTISPLLFLLFIPALSMRVFSEEYNIGTFEIIITKPISELKIV